VVDLGLLSRLASLFVIVVGGALTVLVRKWPRPCSFALSIFFLSLSCTFSLSEFLQSPTGESRIIAAGRVCMYLDASQLVPDTWGPFDV
jgi:hypothetical protein